MTPWRVLITRPEPMASRWRQWLADKGYSAQVVSCMTIEPLTDSASVQRIKNTVLDFDQYQKAIFVSRNAVAEALHWLEDYWPQWPVGVDCFAVGRATAEALRAAGLPVRALGHESGAMNSEALLAAPDLQRVAGGRIVIFRGRGGRALMARVLTERGARVEHCELYQRQRPPSAHQALAQWLRQAAPADLLTAHSGESVNNLCDIAERAGMHAALTRLSIAVPGERVAQLARERGFERICTARNASDNAMLQAIERHGQTS